ncbi:type I restriction enzyme HsdR N-terminal domain-containing protein [Candidatus Chlamydia corallus]|uniref:type I restriction enzyme HsdR N-terminal domain-containing protein n=1 Tax=Candidatus Chlamydia corallus TaxID=2038470 RepID=UPI000C2F8491|nr:type I restriction enzyme HsdR N-terminal domain-containing protein [Candidatus Chlamydia corallus]
MSLLNLPSNQDSASEDSNPQSQIFDPIRNRELIPTPEEKVRQGLLFSLINTLNYPKQLIIIEKELKTLLPLLMDKGTPIPKRRPDIVIITPPTYTDPEGTTHNLGDPKPLLLIECKALTTNQNALKQLLSYNYSIGATCLAMASKHSQLSALFNPKTQTFDFYPGLPEYSQLLNYFISLNL